MKIESDSFRTLVFRVEKGDRRAERELLKKLEAPVARMVRRALRGGKQPSALARRALAEAARFKPGTSQDSQAVRALADEVARSICVSLVEKLRGQPSAWSFLRDTLLE